MSCVERLARLHQVEIDIGRESGDRQHLIEQAAMLRGDAGAHGRGRAAASSARDDGKKLDRLGAGAEDEEDAAGR